MDKKGSFKNLSKWELVAFVVIVSDILIVLVNGAASIIIEGSLKYEYLLIGVIDALVVPLITAPFIIFLFNEENKKAKEAYRIAREKLSEAETAQRDAIKDKERLDFEARDFGNLKINFFDTVSRELLQPMASLIRTARSIKDRLSNRKFEKPDTGGRGDGLDELMNQARSISTGKEALQTLQELSAPSNSLIIAASSISNKLNSIVELAAMQSGMVRWQRRPVELIAVFKSALDRADALLESKKIIVTSNISGDSYVVEADPERIEHAIFNLFEFSIINSEKDRLSYSIRREAGRIICEIEDTLANMPLSMQNSIMTPQDAFDPQTSAPSAGMLYAAKVLRQNGADLSLSKTDIGYRYGISFSTTSTGQGENVVIRKTSHSGI